MIIRWNNHGSSLDSSDPVSLTAGEAVSLEIWKYQDEGSAEARLYWESPLIDRQIIPAAAFAAPLRASSSKPAHRAVDVDQSPVLGWNAGVHALQHDVYFGDDPDVVASADTTTVGVYKGLQDGTSYVPGALEWGKTYYWRIDEINSSHADSPWIGKVWSFTTADFIMLDTAEQYTSESADNAIPIYDPVLGWTDGFLAVADGGNGSGGQAGVNIFHRSLNLSS